MTDRVGPAAPRVSVAVQFGLLELQAIDSRLARLTARLACLPEQAELERRLGDLSTLEGQCAAATVDLERLDRDIAAHERDLDDIDARVTRDQTMLDGGTSPARMVTAVQAELRTLRRMYSQTLQNALSLLDQREQMISALRELDVRTGEAREARDDAQRRRAAAEQALTADIAVQRARRSQLLRGMPAELVARYEKVRDGNGGVGAVALRAGRCEGCWLELSSSERLRIRTAPEDQIISCEECGCILVRAPEADR